MSVLKPGWGNIGMQLGTGVHRGWGHANFWFKDHSEEELEWKESKWICCDCGESLKYTGVPVPYYLKLFKCENGHKFEYQNTD